MPPSSRQSVTPSRQILPVLWVITVVRVSPRQKDHTMTNISNFCPQIMIPFFTLCTVNLWILAFIIRISSYSQKVSAKKKSIHDNFWTKFDNFSHSALCRGRALFVLTFTASSRQLLMRTDVQYQLTTATRTWLCYLAYLWHLQQLDGSALSVEWLQNKAESI